MTVGLTLTKGAHHVLSCFWSEYSAVLFPVSAASSSSKIKIDDQLYERYFLSDLKDELFTNNDHRLNNESEGIDGSYSESSPKPSAKIDLG